MPSSSAQREAMIPAVATRQGMQAGLPTAYIPDVPVVKTPMQGRDEVSIPPVQYFVAPAASLAKTEVIPRTTVGFLVMIPTFLSALMLEVVSLVLPI